MKKLFSLIAVLTLAVTISSAQTWDKFNYQGVARNAQGIVIENQAVGIRITLHSGTAGGASVYQETHSVTTNGFGLFNLAIGGGTVVSGDFSTIDWGSDDFFAQVEMDPSGGNSYTDMGTSQLLAVPYAMTAAKTVNPALSGTANYLVKMTGTETGGNSTVYETGGNIGIGTTSPATKLHVSGSSSELLRLEGNSNNHWLSFYQGSTRKGILWNNQNDMILRSDDAAGVIRFQTNGYNNRMVIDETGHVAIGIATPTTSALFHVVETAESAAMFGAASGSLSYLTVNLPTTANSLGIFRARSNGLTVAVINPTADTYQLQLYGDAFASGGTWQSSDMKLKTGVQDIADALDNILKLTPKSYYFKTDEEYKYLNLPEEKQFGLLAQDVEKVFPNVVRETTELDENGDSRPDRMYSMNYTALIPVLIKGMQEQQQLIVALQKEVELLKNK